MAVNRKGNMVKFDVKDNSGSIIFKVIDLVLVDEQYTGIIKDICTPDRLIELFNQYEKHVNNQEFSHLDDLELEINGFDLRIMESNKRLCDVQIMNVDDISFRIIEENGDES